jgi:hypothetical protein
MLCWVMRTATQDTAVPVSIGYPGYPPSFAQLVSWRHKPFRISQMIALHGANGFIGKHLRRLLVASRGLSRTVAP